MDYPRENKQHLITLLMCNEAMQKEHHCFSCTKQSVVVRAFHCWKQTIVQCLIECSFTMRQANSWHFCSHNFWSWGLAVNLTLHLSGVSRNTGKANGITNLKTEASGWTRTLSCTFRLQMLCFKSCQGCTSFSWGGKKYNLESQWTK